MTFETDEQALKRAGVKQNGEMEWSKSALRGSINLFDREAVKNPDPWVPHTIFFSYMRFNEDGTFQSSHWFHHDAHNEIPADLDHTKKGSLGYYIRDMALHARSKNNTPNTYKPWPGRLDKFDFPNYYSHCIFFMDDLNWEFLLDKKKRPVIKFNDKKDGKTYSKHDHAFSSTTLAKMPMPNRRTGLEDFRQAAIMINRMHDKNNKPLKKLESFSFDLWMRVRYAGSTAGLTLIIDPGGDNQGPPSPPPVLD